MRLTCWFLFFLASHQVSGQRLDPFLSKSYVALNGEARESLPYEKPVRYFDYIKHEYPPAITDSQVVSYYLYFTLPEKVNELGIRLLSPVPELTSPNSGDIETESYMALNLAAKSNWFDAGIILEYGEISDENRFKVIYHLGENHQSHEVPPQPNGKHHNALYRLVREDLPSGTYRITLVIERKEPTTFPTGSYLLEIGTVPAVKIEVNR